jgi:hypothetical protein
MIKQQKLLIDESAAGIVTDVPANTNMPRFVFPSESFSGRRWRNYRPTGGMPESPFSAFNSISTYTPSPYALNSIRYQSNKSR